MLTQKSLQNVDFRVLSRGALMTILCLLAMPAAAKDPGDESYMSLIMSCEGPNANMEIYLPQSIVFKPGTAMLSNILAMKPVIGWYALDLTGYNKGKPLEPVRLSISPDKKFLIVDQYTRGHPPTRIPVTGGTVDFDQRFGNKAKCGTLNTQE
jgi:hypothetical protein